jgi:uncharacterized protein
VICDAHVHFFSPTFFGTLASQRQVATADAIRHLGWDDPVSSEALADRWVAEMNAQGVSRAAIIASVPGDEDSVAEAIARHPSRLVGYFMLDPTKEDPENRVVRALERGLRGVCLFPAMQRYSLHDERVGRIAEILAAFGPTDEAGPTAAGGPTGTARRPLLFVHCGVLTVGARTKLGLPSPLRSAQGRPARPGHTMARASRRCR